MYKTTIFISGGIWNIRSTDPVMQELFGSDVLPTAYTDAMPSHAVIAKLRESNPDTYYLVGNQNEN